MAPRSPTERASSDREVSRDYRLLFRLARFAMPHRWYIAGATLALMVAAGTTLALGSGLRLLIDQGFGVAGDGSLLDRAVLILFGVAVLLALSTFARFYLVSWVGERVVADIRKAVFDHIIGLSPGFFEITRTGEVVSRLTTDTTLLQVVVGSSVSIALRNALLILGGMIMLFITSPKLTLLVLAVVPLVVAVSPAWRGSRSRSACWRPPRPSSSPRPSPTASGPRGNSARASDPTGSRTAGTPSTSMPCASPTPAPEGARRRSIPGRCSAGSRRRTRCTAPRGCVSSSTPRRSPGTGRCSTPPK